MTSGPAAPHFDAFISYNRKKDEVLAIALQRSLQRFAKPWFRARALRVFRDDSDLAANSSLWGSVKTALSASRFLVLLASTESAGSKWVERELQFWFEHRGVDSLLIVVTDPRGKDEPRIAWSEAEGDFDWTRSTSVPKALAGRFADAPRFVDLGWIRDTGDRELTNSRFAEAVADLAAPMWGRDKADLISEDVRQFKRTRRLARWAVSLIALFAVAALVGAVVAVGERNEAELRALIAEARQYAAQSRSAQDPYTALGLALAAERHTDTPLPEARQAYIAAVQRSQQWTSRLIARTSVPAFGDPVWSPDGSRLTLVSSDGSMRSWALSSGAVTDVRPASAVQLSTASWSAGRTTIAWTTGYAQVLAMDTRDAVTRGPFAVPDLPAGEIVENAVPSPDGGTIAARVSDGRVELLSASTGAAVGPALVGPRGYGAVQWSPDGRRLSAVVEGGIRIWTVASAAFVDVAAQPSPTSSSSWSPDSARLAVGAADGSITIVDARTGLVDRPPVAAHAGRVGNLAWSPDGTRLTSSGFDGTVRIWPVTVDGSRGEALATSFGQPYGLAWSADGSMLAVTFSDASVAPVGDNAVVRVWQFPLRPPPTTAYTGASGAITAVSWSPSGLEIAATGERSSSAWDVATAKPRPRSAGVVDAHGTDMAWSPDGRFLAGAAEDGVRVWRSDAMDADVAPLYGSGGALSIAWSPDSARLVVGGDDGSVRVWDAGSGRKVGPAMDQGPAPYGTTAVFRVGWSADGARLLSASADGRVRQWDPVSGSPIGGPTQAVGSTATAAAWSRSGDGLAIAGLGGVIVLAPSQGRPPISLQSTNEVVQTMAWSPDGTRLASSGSGGVVEIWNTADGALLGQTAAQPVPVGSVAWSPDGSQVVSGAADATVRRWTSLGETDACRIAVRELTRTVSAGPDVDIGVRGCVAAAGVPDLPLVPVDAVEETDGS